MRCAGARVAGASRAATIAARDADRFDAAIRAGAPAPDWRHRKFQVNAAPIGWPKARPYDLRHSFVSPLIAEGRTVIDVVQQAGHSPETCLRYYAQLIAVFDPAGRVSAEEQIRRARLGRGWTHRGPISGEAAA
jgi:integrase